MGEQAFIGPGGIGIQELLIILAVVATIFSAGKLPALVRAITRAIRGMRKVGRDVVDDVQNVIDIDPDNT